MHKKNIVILGAGFGGIATYTSLSREVKRNASITIIDSHNYFLFTPLLAEVAGANLDENNIVEPIRDIIDVSTHFIQSKIIAVDTLRQKVILSEGEVPYDTLVSSLGSAPHFFGTPGASEYSYTLDDLESARALRNRCIDIFEEASRTEDGEARKKLLSFIIVGGGPTGVELTGEMASLFFTTFIEQYRNLNPSDISLTLINAGESLISMFDPLLRNYAETSLIKSRVKVLNNVAITEVTAEGVVTGTGERINAGTVVWTAGVAATVLEDRGGSFVLEKGRIKVDEYLFAENTENVFVIGDMAHVPTPEDRGLPMTAQVAKQQGVQTAKNILRLMDGKTLVAFSYREKGLLASIGTFDAVGQIGGIRIYGFLAWFVWRTVYLFNFASWPKRFQIMGDWTINLFTRRDTTRL